MAPAGFEPGQTWADYRPCDKMVGYGVAALIAGGAGAAALKKTGLLGAALISVKKGWLPIPMAVLRLWRLITSLFGRRRMGG